MPNRMIVKGKDVGKKDIDITINLSDDTAEVRGFGQPVTRAKAREMAEKYFRSVESAWQIVAEIESNQNYQALRSHDGFAELKAVLDPESQTVSGVFGKEIILQMLTMKNCEGLRYIVGTEDDGKHTIILIGVEEVAVRDGQASSAPVKPVGTVALDTEVHRESMTIAKVRDEIFKKGLRISDTSAISDVLFGEY